MTVPSATPSKGQPFLLAAPKSVTITLGRWDVRFDIETQDGPVSFIASADSGHTFNDGIWFGTPEEYEEADQW